MKPKDLRPCDNCGATLGPFFFKVDVCRVIVDYRVLRERAGIAAIWDRSLSDPGVFAVADALSSRPLDELLKELPTTSVLCAACGVLPSLSLQELVVKQQDREIEAEQRAEKAQAEDAE